MGRPRPPNSPSTTARFSSGSGEPGPGYLCMSLTSPTPRSLHPLVLSTRRVGSSCRIFSTTFVVFHWPQPSLKGTHMTMQGCWPRPSMRARSSVPNSWADSGERSMSLSFGRMYLSPLGGAGVLAAAWRRGGGGRGGPRVVVVIRPDVFVAAGHVLPDEQAQLVAPIIPAVGFDLDVLAGHVEAEFLGHFDVRAESLVGRRSVNAIGPKTLVEGAELEIGFIVQKHASETVLIFAEGDFAHAEIALDMIDRGAAEFETGFEAVEMRVFG